MTNKYERYIKVRAVFRVKLFVMRTCDFHVCVPKRRIGVRDKGFYLERLHRFLKPEEILFQFRQYVECIHLLVCSSCF
jgi:hypothetical protein